MKKKLYPLMRMAWIESVAIANGSNGLCRQDITEAWQISEAQASADIAAYQAAHPGKLEYNETQKRFVWQGGPPAIDRTPVASLCQRILSHSATDGPRR